MFNAHSVEIDWGGRPLKLETGKIARQADGAVMATYGETIVLATVVAAKAPRAIPYADVMRVLDSIKGAGGNPVGLQIDDLN